MTIPMGPLRLSISLSLSEDSGLEPDEQAAVGMSDGELAHLNLSKRQDLVTAHWEHFHLFIGGTRGP